ncbi:tetratricopeptide repeat protein [Candidatus Margulisiibacteriota bacterium]
MRYLIFVIISILLLTSAGLAKTEEKMLSQEDLALAEIQALYEAEQYKEALFKITNFIDKYPKAKEGFFNLGLIYTQRQRPKLAIKAYERVLQIDPGLAEARINLASLYLDEQLYDKAIKQLQRLLKTNKDNPIIAEKLGILYYNQKKYNQAIDYFKQAIEIAPDKAVAVHNYLGMAYFSIGDKASAQQSLEQARKAYVLTDEGKRLMALLYMDDEKYDEAIQILTKVIKETEPRIDDYNNLGTAYSRKSDFDNAKVIYQKVLEIEPKHKVALSNLGLALIQLEDYEGAKTAFKQLVILTPRDNKAFYNLGFVQEQLMEYGPALTAYLKAKDLGYEDSVKLDRAISYLRGRQEQITTPVQ